MWFWKTSHLGPARPMRGNDSRCWVGPFGTAVLCVSTASAQGASAVPGAASAGEILPPAPVEVKVEGLRASERIEARPDSVRVVEVPAHRPIELAEVLARTEGISVSRAGALGSSTQLAVAGLGGDRIRLFLDGVPLELSGYPGGLATVPTGLIEHAEIYRGVVPARFGADALGGAVQLVSERLTNGKGLVASYEQGSFATTRVALVAARRSLASRTHQRVEAYFDRADNDYPIEVEVPNAQGQLTEARVHRFHDQYRALGIALESGFAAGKWADKLVLRTFAGMLEKELQHNLTMSVPYGDAEYHKRYVGSIVRYAKRWETGYGLQGYVGFSRRDTSFKDVGNCAYDWFGRCVRHLPQPGEITIGGTDQRVVQRDFFGHLEITKPLGSTARLSLVGSPAWLGRDGSDRRRTSAIESYPIEAPRRALTHTSAFAFELEDPGSLLSGSVFAKAHFQSVTAQEARADASIRQVHELRQAWGAGAAVRQAYRELAWAKASYEWATRMPSGDEWFGDGVLIQPNLSIRPERSHNANLSLGIQGQSASYGSGSLGVTAFLRSASDLVVLLGNDAFLTYENVLKANIRGIEARASLATPNRRLSIQVNGTFQDLRNASDTGAFAAFEGDRIPNRPHFMANVSPCYRATGLLSATDEIELGWHSRYVHGFYRSWEGLGQADQKQSVPEQLIHSLSLTYALRTTTSSVTQSIELSNLTDEKSYDFYGMQRPGRAAYAKWTVQL